MTSFIIERSYRILALIIWGIHGLQIRLYESSLMMKHFNLSQYFTHFSLELLQKEKLIKPMFPLLGRLNSILLQ